MEFDVNVGRDGAIAEGYNAGLSEWNESSGLMRTTIGSVAGDDEIENDFRKLMNPEEPSAKGGCGCGDCCACSGCRCGSGNQSGDDRDQQSESMWEDSETPFAAIGSLNAIQIALSEIAESVTLMGNLLDAWSSQDTAMPPLSTRGETAPIAPISTTPETSWSEGENTSRFDANWQENRREGLGIGDMPDEMWNDTSNGISASSRQNWMNRNSPDSPDRNSSDRWYILTEGEDLLDSFRSNYLRATGRRMTS